MAIKQPADKSHFILPDLGEGVHEAELIKWRVQPGEQVEEHQTLAEMETDKALVEVPSPWTGTVKQLHGAEGDIINVGSTLVTYDVAGASSGGNGSTSEREDAGTVVGSVDASLTVPDTFTRRRSDAVTATSSGKTLATPAVRRVAKEMGVEIGSVPGSGRGGRVTASDVYAFASGTTAAPAPTAPSRAAPHTMPTIDLPSVPISADGVIERVPFRGVRRKIAESLMRSVQTTVHFTVVDEADVTALDTKRQEYGRVLGRKMSLLPFIMTAVCRALRVHPALNAIVDDENDEILLKHPINLGCAVDTDHGLMVPVIESADQLSPVLLADKVTDLATGCRNRSIPREKLVGGTFTISNVGSYGGMFATPIINYPEVGILAAGRAKERVLTKGGMFYAGLILPLSLSCDHRVVDGAEGARFLSTVVAFLENPEQLVA